MPGCVYVRKRDGVPSSVPRPAGRSSIRTEARCIVVVYVYVRKRSLMKYEQVVLYPIHGATASNFRTALYPSGSKDDHKDADLLLDLLIQHRAHIRRLDPDTEETRKLQLLVEAVGPQAAAAHAG